MCMDRHKTCQIPSDYTVTPVDVVGGECSEKFVMVVDCLFYTLWGGPIHAGSVTVTATK